MQILNEGPVLMRVKGHANQVPTLRSATVNASTLTLTFSSDLDPRSAPAGSAFTVIATPSGGDQAQNFIGTGTASVSGGTATVSLSSYLELGEELMLVPGLSVPGGATVTVSYTEPEMNPLQDAGGNKVAAFTDRAATNYTGVPSVSRVAFSSTPSIDTDGDNTPDTYGRGAKIRVQVTFHTSVNVDTTDGTPRLEIILNPASLSKKWAVYESGSGTKVLTFAYTVVQGNKSDGFEVPGNALELNGGTIRATNSVFATLTHAAVARANSHAVDGMRDAQQPSDHQRGGGGRGSSCAQNAPPNQLSDPRK